MAQGMQGTKQQQQPAVATTPTTTVADTIVQQLQAWGVQRVYGVVGDTFLDLMDAMETHHLPFVAVKHESVAAFMASAEAKLTGRVGVCLATSGPGMANLLNGLGDAYQDKAPVLAITGQVPTKQIGTDSKQYLNQQTFIAPLAAYSECLTSPDATVEILAKALHTAEQWGAVTHVSVPKDLFGKPQTKPLRTKPPLIQGTMQFDTQQVAQAVEILRSAERPCVVAGLGARSVAQEVQQLCQALGAGLIVSMAAKGAFDERFDHLLGGLGKGGNPYASDVLKQADVVLLVGDTWWPEGYVPQETRIVQIDYAAANIGTQFNVELGLVGDTRTIVPALVQQVGHQQPNGDWLANCRQARDRFKAEIEREATTEGTPVHPARVVRALQEAIRADAIVCVDTGDHSVWYNRIFESKQHVALFSGTWRSMGFALPAAIAAQLEHPERQVVALVGDGGLGMTLADLSTAVRYNVPITVVVMNNGNLQMETDRQRQGQHTTLGSDLTNPDFVKIAEACGLAGFRVTDSRELAQTLQQAVSLPGPVLVDVVTDDVVFPVVKAEEL